jgi:hypothetical protein
VESVREHVVGVTTVARDAQADRTRREDQLGVGRMGQDLVHVGVDVDRGLPRLASVSGPRDPPDMDVHVQVPSAASAMERVSGGPPHGVYQSSLPGTASKDSTTSPSRTR